MPFQISISWVAASPSLDIFEEGALVETVQWGLLAIAAALFLYQAMREKDKIDRSLAVLFVIILVTLILREIDVEDFALPKIFIFLGRGIGRNTWVGAAWALYAWFAIFHRRLWFPRMRHLLLRTRAGWALALGCTLYVAGFPFDREWLPIGAGSSRVVEELLEFAGCVVFLASALLLVRSGMPRPAASTQPRPSP